MNQVVLVGKVKEKPIVRETSSGNKIADLILEVERPYKNSEGNYDHDVFEITLWKSLAESAQESIKEGMSVGIKGRLGAANYVKDNNINYRCDIVAEKICLYQETIAM